MSEEKSLAEATFEEGLANFLAMTEPNVGDQEKLAASEKAIELYEKARLYVGDDPLVHFFLGMNYLFVGKKKEGKALLEPMKKHTFDWAVSPETVVEDYLEGRADADALKAVYLHVDEKRQSVLEKQKKLQDVLKISPLPCGNFTTSRYMAAARTAARSPADFRDAPSDRSNQLRCRVLPFDSCSAKTRL